MKNIFRMSVMALVATVGIFLNTGAAYADDIPSAPTVERPVVDMTGTLTSSDISKISEATQNDASKDDYTQIAVLMVSNIPSGKSVETASLDVARAWGVGSTNDKNGVLLYVAKDDRELRIEVADNAGVYLTDAEANRIIRNSITPEFKNGDYTAGIEAGVSEIRAELSGTVGSANSSTTVDYSGFWRVVGFILLVAVIIAGIVFLVLYLDRLVERSRKKKKEIAEQIAQIPEYKEKIQSLNSKVRSLNSTVESNKDLIKNLRAENRSLKKDSSKLALAYADPDKFIKGVKAEIAEEKRKAEAERKERERLESLERERREAEARYWASPEGQAEMKRIKERERRKAEEARAAAERRRKEKEEEERKKREEERRKRRLREEKERRDSYYSSSSSSFSSSSFGGGGSSFGGGGGFSGGGSSGSW